MEQIYRASGHDYLELALEYGKNNKWLFFKHLVLTCTIVLMDDFGLDDREFAGNSDFHS